MGQCRRRFGGTIPIVFHWVLAGYLFVLEYYHRRAELTSCRADSGFAV